MIPAHTKNQVFLDSGSFSTDCEAAAMEYSVVKLLANTINTNNQLKKPENLKTTLNFYIYYGRGGVSCLCGWDCVMWMGLCFFLPGGLVCLIVVLCVFCFILILKQIEYSKTLTLIIFVILIIIIIIIIYS